jgi:hypothetical protein
MKMVSLLSQKLITFKAIIIRIARGKSNLHQLINAHWILCQIINQILILLEHLKVLALITGHPNPIKTTCHKNI